MEKDLKKYVGVYIYIYFLIGESPCCTPKTNTTLQINYFSSIKNKIEINPCSYGQLIYNKRGQEHKMKTVSSIIDAGKTG